MNGAYNIILITGEKATHEMVNNLLKDQTHFVLAEVLPSLSALLDENRDSGKVPAEILVDCGDDPEGDILELELATTQMPDSRFILLCDHIEQDIVFKAMEGGARYVFPRSSLDNKHILEELKRLVPRKHISYNGGKLITVTACSGGCGATTFACNLANELGIIARQPALFIDMDFYYAGATSYMNMVGHYGLKDILQHEDIDDHLLQSSVVSLAPSLDGIPGIGPLELPASAHNVKMRELLRLCKRLYPYTIVDLRGLSEPLSGTVGDMSELLFVIMQLTVKDI
ncbi:MAG: AAA family ATPase, partial [Planctomycetota bacterium]